MLHPYQDAIVTNKGFASDPRSPQNVSQNPGCYERFNLGRGVAVCICIARYQNSKIQKTTVKSQVLLDVQELFFVPHLQLPTSMPASPILPGGFLLGSGFLKRRYKHRGCWDDLRPHIDTTENPPMAIFQLTRQTETKSPNPWIAFF